MFRFYYCQFLLVAWRLSVLQAYPFYGAVQPAGKFLSDLYVELYLEGHQCSSSAKRLCGIGFFSFVLCGLHSHILWLLVEKFVSYIFLYYSYVWYNPTLDKPLLKMDESVHGSANIFEWFYYDFAY